MQKEQLRQLIKETLLEANLFSSEATELLMMTCAQESQLGFYIEQLNGPAKGIMQMEPNTFHDIWENYLLYNPSIKQRLFDTCDIHDKTDASHLKWNLRFSILMARIHYLRFEEAIPGDLDGLAKYYKKYYNTYKGAAVISEVKDNYNKYCV